MGLEKMKAHWRYLVARYGAWPVVWCAAGEGNLPYYLAPKFPYDDREQAAQWTQVMRYIRETDPYHRLLTVHPTAINRYTSRHVASDPAVLDFDMLQTSHGRVEAVPMTIQAMRDSCIAKPTMPVINGEASYEMLGDNLPTEWTRRMFWVCMMNGAAGHTYGANGIWQCNRPGEPHGASPHGGSYGKLPWNEAMNLPGASQMGYGRKFFESLPWTQFKPHPEWASSVETPPPNLEGCSWIWFPEGDPTHDAPGGQPRFFRRSFTLPAEKSIARARLLFAADNQCSVRLNGKLAGNHDDWRAPGYNANVGALLHSGENILAVQAMNEALTGASNPAGLIVCLEVEYNGGGTQRIVSDSKWVSSKTRAEGWDRDSFDTHEWSAAMEVAKFGAGPWGRIAASHGGGCPPQATGIPGGMRVVYSADASAVRLRALEPTGVYLLTRFDPVTGRKDQAISTNADRAGEIVCPPPADCQHDWVVVMELVQPRKMRRVLSQER